MTIVVHDVLIVGAGPAGLAVAARLREPTPSAVFTDAEHVRSLLTSVVPFELAFKLHVLVEVDCPYLSRPSIL